MIPAWQVEWTNFDGTKHLDDCDSEQHAQQYAHEMRETLQHGFGIETPVVTVVMVLVRR